MRTLGLLLLAACQQAHTVVLQLGPTEDTLTAGFACVQDADPTRLLATRALQPDGTLRFAVIVDVIALGGRLPGCRGEELFAACSEGGCAIVPRADGTRFCREIVVDRAAVTAATADDLEPLLESLRSQLRAEPVTLDAPDEPVLIRALATAEDCTTAQLDLERLVGCAYSCPAQLDEVEGAIALSLDTLSRQCEREVKACAVFPP